MDSSRAKTFQQMADELGIRHKLMYTLREASRVTGVPTTRCASSARRAACARSCPRGRKVGRMVRPEWVEQWIEEGTHGIEAALGALRTSRSLFAVYALMPYVLRAMLLAADGIRVVLGMGSVL